LTAIVGRFKVPPLQPKQEDFMRSMCMLAIAGLTLAACSSTEWVHPNKPSSEYINDYNKCQNLVQAPARQPAYDFERDGALCTEGRLAARGAMTKPD
jgi:hypothetical protein